MKRPKVPDQFVVGRWFVVWLGTIILAVGGGGFALGKFVFELVPESTLESDYVSKSELFSWGSCVDKGLEEALDSFERGMSDLREAWNNKHATLFSTYILRSSSTKYNDVVNVKNADVIEEHIHKYSVELIMTDIPRWEDRVRMSIEDCKLKNEE